MTTDPALAIAVPFTVGFEGFRSEPYLDTGGIPTIGFGFRFMPDDSPVTMATPPMTRAAAEERLAATLGPTLARVRELVRVKIGNNAAAALCSFAFNCGTGSLARSTLLRLLNEGAPLTQVAGQFAAWVHDARGNVDPGLIRRRAAEAALFLRSDAAKPPPGFELDLRAQTVVPDEADELDAEFNPAPAGTSAAQSA